MISTIANLFISIFGVNWKTNINGWLLLICGTETAASTFNVVHIVPVEWQPKLMAVCMVFAAFGLLGAKDNNVSNAPKPAESQKVPAEAP